jgi:hypothetical protein
MLRGRDELSKKSKKRRHKGQADRVETAPGFHHLHDRRERAENEYRTSPKERPQ